MVEKDDLFSGPLNDSSRLLNPSQFEEPISINDKKSRLDHDSLFEGSNMNEAKKKKPQPSEKNYQSSIYKYQADQPYNVDEYLRKANGSKSGPYSTSKYL